jgi:hypothetical protein
MAAAMLENVYGRFMDPPCRRKSVSRGTHCDKARHIPWRFHFTRGARSRQDGRALPFSATEDSSQPRLR